MRISILTYNLLFHEAFSNIKALLNKHKPDIACFQEMESDEKGFEELEEEGYKLADYSNSFIRAGKVYCVATFYRSENISLKESECITLPRSYYEVFLYLLRGNHEPRTVLKSEFILNNSKSLTHYNVHLTALATNGARARQLIHTLKDLKLHNKEHVIISGDFNYPYGRKKFEELIKDCQLEEATSRINFTFEKRFFGLISVKLKDDYVLYKNLNLVQTEKINVSYSDHYPILSTFDI